MKKTMYITLCMDIMRRNIIETDFWSEFIAPGNVDVVFVVQAGKAEFYQEQFKDDPVTVYELPPHSTTFAQKVITSLGRTAVRAESIRFYFERAALDGQISRLSLYSKRLQYWLLGNRRWWKRLLRALFARTKTDPVITQLFDEIPPDLVFATSVIDHSFDAPLINEAKRRGVRVVGMTRSWDNLTSHGLVLSLPDRFIFQNRFLKEMAELHQAIPQTEINPVIGLPHYDAYHDPSALIEDRSSFFARLGLDPNKKLLFYPGVDMHRSEHVFPDVFEQLIAANAFDEPVQMVYRPHPSSYVDPEKLGPYEHVTIDGVFSAQKKAGAVTKFDTNNFVNLAYHCDVLINSGSTVSIDGAVFKKPVVCLNFDAGLDLPYWIKAGRMYTDWTHYIYLAATGGVAMVESEEALVAAIKRYLTDPQVDAAGQTRLIDLLVAPFDGGASRRLAGILKDEIAAL